MCRFESLLDGTLSLDHVCLMNMKLDVDAENERRAYENVRKAST